MLNRKLKGVAPDLTGKESVAYSPLKFTIEPCLYRESVTSIPGEPLEIISNNNNGTVSVRLFRDISIRLERTIDLPSDCVILVDPAFSKKQNILALSSALGFKISHAELISLYSNDSNLLESFLEDRDIRIPLISSEYLRLANLYNRSLKNIPIESKEWSKYAALVTNHFHISEILAKVERNLRSNFSSHSDIKA